MREIVCLFLQNIDDKITRFDLTTFSFLYGTIPSAPGVFVYATAYGLDIDLVSHISIFFLNSLLILISWKK